MKSKAFWWVVVLALLAGNIFFGLQYFELQKELEGIKTVSSSQHYNEMVLKFVKLFIKRVIKSDKEVDFDTRLKLENAVRELDDAQILSQWQKFVNSSSEVEAQKNVKELLDILIDKVYIR